MSTVTANYAAPASTARPASATERVATILRFTYGLVPIVAGADKFTELLVNWDQYLAPSIVNILPFEAHTFMLIVGVIEIVAGLLVLVRPRIGSIVVCGWLVAIALNLLISGSYIDVAVRDLVMAVGAFCLFLLAGREKD